MKCEHCFYWQNLNRPDDLSFDELVDLSRQLGRIENLNLSGGEPFLREEFGAICREFIRRNGVREIYVPTNGYFTDKTIAQIRETLRERDLRLFVVELSLDGMPEFHDRFRVVDTTRSPRRCRLTMPWRPCNAKIRGSKFTPYPRRPPRTSIRSVN